MLGTVSATDALALNRDNSKALYRRALARYGVGMLDLALQDLEQFTKAQTSQMEMGTAEALNLAEKIHARMTA